MKAALGGIDFNQLLWLVLFFFVVMSFLRYRYGKLAKDNVRCFFTTDEGTGYHMWFPVVNGKLLIKPSKTRAAAIYPVGNLNTVITDFPEGVPGFMSFIQVKAKTVALDEHTAEPILNRGACLMLTPQRIYNSYQERFTGLAAGQSVQEKREIEKETPKPQASSNSSFKWMVAFVIIGALVLVGFLLYQKFGVSKAALGLP